MPLTTAEILSDLPEVLSFLSAFQDALVATKGESSLTRDFDILIALMPKLKALAVKIEDQVAS